MIRLQRQLELCLEAHLAGRYKAVPEGGRLVWRWFSDLCRTRTGGFGPNPISHAEIEAYARLYGWPLEPRHVDLIFALDRVWLRWARAAVSPEDGVASPVCLSPASSQPLTPEAFDAVFA